MTNNQFALISHMLPPDPSGQAVMLYRILSGLPSRSYYLIHSKTALTQYGNNSISVPLEGEYYYLKTEAKLEHSDILIISIIRNVINISYQMIVRTRNIVKIIRNNPDTKAIIACTGDIADIPAGFFASIISRLPFYAYLFDDYVYQWLGVHRLFAKIMGRLIFEHSAGVIGPNEFICEEYKNRYGIKSTLVRNPYASIEAIENADYSWPTENEKIKIIYTGAVYHANYDCFLNLIQAISKLSDFNLELNIYTSQTLEELKIHGINCNKVVIHSYATYQEILEQQQKADILFLPLAFDSEIPEVIRNSAPGKMGEYLISGRPVLAHVPADSFVAYFFKKHQCGWLADQNDSHHLAIKIEEIITQKALRDIIKLNARQVARDEFSPDLARKQLISQLLQTPASTSHKF